MLQPSARVDLSCGLLCAAQVAALLGVQRRKVYELARREHDPLPAIKLDGQLRFVRAEIEGWLAGQRPVLVRRNALLRG